MSATDSAEMKKLIDTVLAMRKQMASLESQLATLTGVELPPAGKRGRKARKPRDPDAPKREPNDWIKFTQRVRELLKEKDLGFKMAKHGLAFAKSLKEVYPEYTCDDKQILAARKTWVPPVAAEESAAEETAAETSAAEETGDDAPKKRGRKPMTDEQKAEAKAAREAKKSASK